ncbi:hypothetical protein GIB67_017992 [Kingdonia uniflora]|uniref:Uncharacterized protein n=1 Tax=Kingdonia uniflora TaxID=39325 RepID=A0A7J7NX38_9MAGN|nr:hypothetical protein GIB67_017992 [Kingdonia uniflora]
MKVEQLTRETATYLKFLEKRQVFLSTHEKWDGLHAVGNNEAYSERRVVEERCESAPGSDHSLVGFQETYSKELTLCKNFVMREAIQSWEAFQKIPQKPYFRSLEKSNAKAREGDALRHMVTFSNLVEATCKFQLDDPISNFEETLKALAELELHGFDVQKI